MHSSIYVLVSPNSVEQAFKSESRLFYLRVKVPLTAANVNGFRAEIIDCPPGFVWKVTCVCPVNHFVLADGSCLPCPPDTVQPQENKSLCISTSPQASQAGETSRIGKDFWNYIDTTEAPPSYLGTTTFVENLAVSLGGLLNGNEFDPIFAPLSEVVVIDYADSPRWIRHSATGNIPSGRYGHCAVFTHERVFVLGGRLQDPNDNRVYQLQLQEMRWTKTVFVPVLVEGHACVVHNQNIFIAGGIRSESTKTIAPMLRLSLDLYLWEELHASAVDVRFSYSATALLDRRWFFYGGIVDGIIQEETWLLNLDSLSWVRLGKPTLDTCLPCLTAEDCPLARQKPAFVQQQSTLWIMGGLTPKGLADDILAINLESNTISSWKKQAFVIRTKTETYPLSGVGGSIIARNRSLEVQVGASNRLGCMTSSRFAYHLDFQQVFSFPNHLRPSARTNPLHLQLNDTHMLFFGGQSCISSGKPLMDTWFYNSDSSAWIPANFDLPATAQSNFVFDLIGLWDSTVSILCHSLDRADLYILRHKLGSSTVWERLNLLFSKEHPKTTYIRDNAAIAYSQESFYLYGGQTREAYFRDAILLVRVSLSSQKVVAMATVNSPENIILGTAAISGEYFYLTGGIYADWRPNTQMFRLNTTSLKWESLGQLPSPRLLQLSLLLFHDNSLVIVGVTSSQSKLYTAFAFDRETQTWSRFSSSSSMQRGLVLPYGKDQSQLATFFITYASSESNHISITYPSFCPALEDSVYRGDEVVKTVDFGSEALGYRTNMTCEWTFRNTSMIFVDFNLHPNDSLTICEGDSLSSVRCTRNYTGSGQTSLLLTAMNGFLVRFHAKESTESFRKGYKIQIRFAGCQQIGLQLPTSCRCSSSLCLDVNTLQCIPCNEMVDDTRSASSQSRTPLSNM
eukprot:TRINITY_DN503_c0_g1_i4.p1 TRINITY_DN503_c0_g1~~TRINITY_DN503_c0_g1_i4.p1  ORF type:complete len:908 (+),score=155.16 TRINITY_DN503_c0_g1_i4:2560-5283(+)